MTLDGRFLVEEDFGNFAGQPLKSFKMVGYNNASRRYEGIWTYTMSTAIMSLNGTTADGGKTVSFAATFDNEAESKRSSTSLCGRLTMTTLSWTCAAPMPDGKSEPRLETTYTRKK